MKYINMRKIYTIIFMVIIVLTFAGCEFLCGGYSPG